MARPMSTLAWARNIPRAWVKILRFHFSHVRDFGQVHPDLPSGRLLQRLSQGEAEVSLPVAFRDKFNSSYDLLKLELTRLLGSANFERVLIGSFAVRALQCVIVWNWGWKVGILAGLLQFVVAPLSLTSSFIRLCTNISDCLIHYALNLLAVLLSNAVRSVLPSPRLRFGPTFVIGFFAFDFALNCFVYWRTSEPFGARRLCKHILYGTFNTKTYFVVVLGCLYKMEFDLFVVLMTGLLVHVLQTTGLEKALLQAVRWPCFEVCFYVEHRVGHMPVVYQHSHKMHHYLHDSTPFDAHIYGSGMNEEFFWILAETLPALLAPGVFFPYFFNPVTLYVSWTNKGAHARTADGVTLETLGCFDEDNYHADHHTLHRTNFGSSGGVIIDFYMGTAGPTTKGSGGMAYAVAPDAKDSSRVLVSIRRAQGLNRADRCPVPADGLCLDYAVDVPKQAWMDLQISVDLLSSKKSLEDGGIWLALHGGVFDVTSFLRGHPGGPQILLSHAGSDATRAYEEVGHSPKATNLAMRRYIIGTLEDCKPDGFVADVMVHR